MDPTLSFRSSGLPEADIEALAIEQEIGGFLHEIGFRTRNLPGPSTSEEQHPRSTHNSHKEPTHNPHEEPPPSPTCAQDAKFTSPVRHGVKVEPLSSPLSKEDLHLWFNVNSAFVCNPATLLFIVNDYSRVMNQRQDQGKSRFATDWDNFIFLMKFGLSSRLIFNLSVWSGVVITLSIK